jgi:hypothetical protein
MERGSDNSVKEKLLGEVFLQRPQTLLDQTLNSEGITERETTVRSPTVIRKNGSSKRSKRGTLVLHLQDEKRCQVFVFRWFEKESHCLSLFIVAYPLEAF